MITTTKFFHYDPKDRTFSQEISTLEGNGMAGGGQPTFHQIYQDSCDVGLTLVSAATGKEVDYVVSLTEKDAEGDVQCWHLVPTKQALRKVPEARGTSIVIFND